MTHAGHAVKSKGGHHDHSSASGPSHTNKGKGDESPLPSLASLDHTRVLILLTRKIWALIAGSFRLPVRHILTAELICFPSARFFGGIFTGWIFYFRLILRFEEKLGYVRAYRHRRAVYGYIFKASL